MTGKQLSRAGLDALMRAALTDPGVSHVLIPRRDRFALRPEPRGELAVEDVEQVGVVAVDVEVGALAARTEARPRRVQRLGLGEDLDPPVRRVADHLAAPGRDDARLAHAVVEPLLGFTALKQNWLTAK